MTIEITEPETEALLEKNLKSGAFASAEEVILKALWSLEQQKIETGASLVAAMQSSPYRELNLEPPRYPMPVREVDI